ncbi:AAA family ATPase [Streptosporangium sp. NPDC006930]|uniref:AAA family ATPase n=1 Tax=Streptosporangium sp. NPDC006930 TaxID=3154783 RepID=UPI00342F4CB3
MAVQGPSGDGKSYQLAKSLEIAGFQPIALSGAALSGNHEGDSTNAFKDLYERAQSYQLVNDEWPALILEDFELSPAGQREDSKYTVNSQLLTGFLMNLSEKVSSTNMGVTKRYPVFLTGNDFTILHKPLMRPGRMDIFTWVPTPEEQSLMILSALQKRVPSVCIDDARRLQTEFPKLPIATFAAALNDCLAKFVYDHLRANENIRMSSIRREFNVERIQVSLNDVRVALHRRDQSEFTPGCFI